MCTRKLSVRDIKNYFSISYRERFYFYLMTWVVEINYQILFTPEQIELCRIKKKMVYTSNTNEKKNNCRIELRGKKLPLTNCRQLASEMKFVQSLTSPVGDIRISHPVSVVWKVTKFLPRPYRSPSITSIVLYPRPLIHSYMREPASYFVCLKLEMNESRSNWCAPNALKHLLVSKWFRMLNKYFA